MANHTLKTKYIDIVIFKDQWLNLSQLHLDGYDWCLPISSVWQNKDSFLQLVTFNASNVNGKNLDWVNDWKAHQLWDTGCFMILTKFAEQQKGHKHPRCWWPKISLSCQVSHVFFVQRRQSLLCRFGKIDQPGRRYNSKFMEIVAHRHQECWFEQWFLRNWQLWRLPHALTSPAKEIGGCSVTVVFSPFRIFSSW